IAIEPVSSTFARLEDNIRLNGLGSRVAAYCCALSSAPGQLEFVTSLDTMNRVALPGETLSTAVVPVPTLDELGADRCPTIIKMDVEGHEHAVLEGAKAVLANAELRAVLMETNQSGARYGVPDAALFEVMERAGFEACDYDPFNRRLSPQR